MDAIAVFDEEDAARAVADRLRVSGFAASVARGRFHGEDDDEDQPWQVVTDAPAFMLEILADEHDGWVEDTTPTPPPAAPLELPRTPRRHHNPPGAEDRG